MQRAMSSRTVCTSADRETPRYKYLGDSGVTKVRRTRKAPDFYSPEGASKNIARRLQKMTSDDNDSWKPESESDEANSESESERSNGRRDKSGARRRLFQQKSLPEDERPEIETEEGRAQSPSANDIGEEEEEEEEEEEGMSESDADDKSSKDRKGDARQKEKKVKGCRELQDLLDGCVQVHKESRTRRLPPRREHSRTVHANGQSDSTWSHGSSRAVTDKDGGQQPTEEKQNRQSSSKQPSSVNPSSVQDAQKTIDSSTENPLTAEMSETVDDEPKPLASIKEVEPYVKNTTVATCTRRSKTTTETASDSSIRVKRQRVESDTTQTRKMIKPTENGTHSTKGLGRDGNKEDAPVIRLPRMPMVRHGMYWYRARIKQETRESVFLEFTGFEDGLVKPFWRRKDSPDVFKGSYSGKDWKYAGDGAWEPKPRKMSSKKIGARGGRKGKKCGTLKTSESRDQCQSSKYQQDFTDQGCTADSEKCSKPTIGVLGGTSERVFYRKSSGDGQKPGCLEKAHSADSMLGMLDSSGARLVGKNLDCGSQSDVHAKDDHSEDSFPKCPNSQRRTAFDVSDVKRKEEDGQHWTKTTSGGSPFSRNVEPSASSQAIDGLAKHSRKISSNSTEPNRKDNSSSVGNENSEERVPARLRRKPGKIPNGRQEEDGNAPPGRQKTLRRSARLGPKGSWRFKDDSSSEAEYEEDSLNTSACRRNGSSRPAMSTYVTRSVRNSETGRRNSGALSVSHTLHRSQHVQKPHRSIFPTALHSKRRRKPAARVNDLKDDFDGEDNDELLVNANPLELRSPRNRNDHALVPGRLEGGQRTSSVENAEENMWSLGVNVLSQIRKYLPYYSDHIPDTRLSAFVELMERMEGIGVKHDTVLRHPPDTSAAAATPVSTLPLPLDSLRKDLALPSIPEMSHMKDGREGHT